MATIKEIAALAGVSRGTVDRVLNNRGSVRPETARKIQEIVKSLDYRPNPAGQGLAARKKNWKIGVVLFSTENSFFQEVLEGIHRKAEELSHYNCSVLVKQIPFRVEEQLHALDELAKQEVAAIAMTPYNDERIRRYIDALYEQGIPVVTFNSDIEFSRRIAYVGSNYTQSGATAAGLIRLLTHGETHVGIVTGSHQLLCHSQRIAGFTEALKPYQHRIHLTATVENHDDEIESYEQTLHLLQEHPEINALFFAAGGVYGGCRAVSALGLEGHLTILSYDMVPTTRALLEQGIISATICQQPALQGSRPLSILFDYLTNGKLPSAERYYTAADIRIRENL